MSEYVRAEYARVQATAAEVDAWRRKYGPRQAPPKRVQCECGARFWLSGIGLGSHRRSARHNDYYRALTSALR